MPKSKKKAVKPQRKVLPPAAGLRKTTVATRPAEAGPVKIRKTYLSKAELEEYRDILVQKRRTLVGDLNGMTEETIRPESSGNLSNMPTHMADVGTDTFEHEFTLGLLESEQSLLREIDEALARIDNSTYGMCLGTGEAIPKARLKAKPWAKYTVEYMRLLEKGLIRPQTAGSGTEDEDEPEAAEDENADAIGEAAEEEAELPEEEPEPEE